MYHEFIDLKQEQRVKNKLDECIRFYLQQQQNSKQQQPSMLLDLQYSKQINIEMSLYNDKHRTKLFVLSNGKVLRYDYNMGQIYEVEGLQGVYIREIKVLDIGNKQRYVLMSNDGVYVCTIREKQSFNETDIQKQQQQQQMEQQTLTKQVGIESISCELSGSVFIPQTKQIGNNNNNQQQLVQQQQHLLQQQQQQQQQHQQQQAPQSMKYRRMFIVNDNNNKINRNILKNKNNVKNNNKNDKVDSIQQQQQQQSVYVVVINQAGWQMNYSIMVYQVKLIINHQHKDNTMQQQQLSSQKIITKNNHTNTFIKQSTYISPIKLPNNQYSIELILSRTDIQSLIKQNRQLDHIQIKNQNFINIRAHPIIKVDSQLSNYSTFSIYFATQCITELMEPQEYRHKVFQFVFKLERRVINQGKSRDDKIMKQNYIVQQDNLKYQYKISASIFKLSQKQVIHPNRVYYLPLVNQSSILSYFNITKTAIKNKHQSPLLSPKNIFLIEDHYQQTEYFYQQSIKLTAVIVLPSNKLTFMGTEIRFSKQNIQQFSFYLNEENMSLSTTVDQSFTLRDVLIFDYTKKYAIILVSRHSIKINFSEQSKLQLVVLNLTQNIPSIKRVVGSQSLQEQFNDSICSLSIHIPLDSQIYMSKSIYQFSQNQINLPKFIMITNAKIKNNLILKTIQLIPKIQIYKQILQNIISQKQNQKISLWKQQNLNLQTFVYNVIKLLAN